MQDARTTTDDGHAGLTKRELIAGLVAAGMCANPEMARHLIYQRCRIADLARDQADALLAALAGGAK